MFIGSILPASVLNVFRRGCLLVLIATNPSIQYKQHESNLANKLKIREISDGSVQRDNLHTSQSRFSEIDMWFGLLSLNISESSQPSHSQIKSVHATTEAKIKVPTSKCAAKYMHDQTTTDRPSSWEISTDIRQTFTCSVTIRSSKAKIYQKNFV